jgi:hypothetical protein
MFDEKANDLEKRGKYNYNQVSRWSRKVPGRGNIFNLKYIFVPINLDNSYWTLAVIFMEDKKIQYYDLMGSTDKAKLVGLLSTAGRLDGWTAGRLDGWMAGRLDGWRAGRLEGWRA